MSHSKTDNTGALPRSILAGAIVGVDNISRTVALTAFIFGGALSAGVPLALVLFLVTNVLATCVYVAGRALPAPLFSSVQNAPVAVLYPATLTLSATGEPTAIFLLLGATAVASGLAMTAIGFFDLGRFVRLVPYPVAAGFLAAVGALLARSAFGLVYPGNLADLAADMAEQSPEALLPMLSIGFAIVLGLSVWLFRNTGVILALIIGLAGTYGVFSLQGIDLAAARDMGLLQPRVSGIVLPSAEDLSTVVTLLDQNTLQDILPIVGAATVISLFGIMLNSAGAELILDRDIDSRHGLVRAGAVNILTGAAGSTISYLSASTTAMSQQLGSLGRAPIWSMCALTVVAIPFASDIYNFVPTFVSAGLLLFIGASIVKVWVLDQFRRLGRADWLLSLTIVVVSILFGMVTAIGVGVVAASVIFAVLYARLPVIRSTSDLRTRRSRVDRGPAQTAFLDAHGDEVAIVSLQGFLFFGTAMYLTAHIRGLLEKSGKIHTVILDFRRVSRVDASAIATIRRIELLAGSYGTRVVLSEMNHETNRDIRRSYLSLGPNHILQTARTTDEALEAVEVEMLSRLEDEERQESAASALDRITGNPAVTRRILMKMSREQVAKGTRLITQGHQSGDIYLIDEGRLSVLLNLPDGGSLRLRTMAEGSLVGEVASYAGLKRTADVVAETDAVVYHASTERIAAITGEDPVLAAALHRMVAATLADKLDRTNKLLGDAE